MQSPHITCLSVVVRSVKHFFKAQPFHVNSFDVFKIPLLASAFVSYPLLQTDPVHMNPCPCMSPCMIFTLFS